MATQNTKKNNKKEDKKPLISTARKIGIAMYFTFLGTMALMLGVNIWLNGLAENTNNTNIQQAPNQTSTSTEFGEHDSNLIKENNTSSNGENIDIYSNNSTDTKFNNEQDYPNPMDNAEYNSQFLENNLQQKYNEESLQNDLQKSFNTQISGEQSVAEQLEITNEETNCPNANCENEAKTQNNLNCINGTCDNNKPNSDTSTVKSNNLLLNSNTTCEIINSFCPNGKCKTVND